MRPRWRLPWSKTRLYDLPRILFITSPTGDYLSLNLLHGLRELLGTNVVDYPKAEHGYSNASASMRKRVYGRGFTAFLRMEDIEVERDDVWQRAAENEFDLIVFGDINRSWGLFSEWGLPLVDRIPVVLVDGADSPAMYPKGPTWWRRRAWWFLPRTRGVSVRFKRELGPWTHRTAFYGFLPASIGKRVGRTSKIRPISFAIPSDNLVSQIPVKTKDFPEHIVDPEVAQRLNATESYAFNSESDYYTDLRNSRFGVTVKRAGWDCMRHYEIAASGTIPCFRQLSRKPDSCAPHGLRDGVNCIEYSNADELLKKIGNLDPETEMTIAATALAWAKKNTTVELAKRFLSECDTPIGSAEPGGTSPR